MHPSPLDGALQRVDYTHTQDHTRQYSTSTEKDTQRPVDGASGARLWGETKAGKRLMCCSYRCASRVTHPWPSRYVNIWSSTHTYHTVPSALCGASRCLAGDALEELLYFLGHIAPRPLHIIIAQRSAGGPVLFAACCAATIESPYPSKARTTSHL